MAAADKLNGAYWRKRAIELAEKQKQEDDDLCLRFHREYERILHELDKEISIFYARYAANESVSMADARRLLRDAELEDFRMSLDEFRDKALAGGFDKELEEVYLRSRISRLQALQTQVELRMMELFSSQRDVLRDHLQERYMDTYYRTVYAVSQQMNVASTFARIDPQTVEKILAVPWLGSEFSSRIWADKDKLNRELMQTLSRGFVRGDSLDRMTKEFTQRMGVSESRAATLIHTESAHMAAEAAEQGYRETGVQSYRFEAALDLKTCTVCGALDQREFPLAEHETGINYPPLHPRCRCTTVPVTEFRIGSKRAARNPATGKTEYVEKKLTYEEWWKKYVDGDVKTSEPVTEPTKSAIIKPKIAENGDAAVQNEQPIYRTLGKLKTEYLEKRFGKLQTDELIIMDERLEHIRERHPEDVELFEKYGAAAALEPDTVLVDGKHDGTVFMVKGLPDTNLNVVVRLALDTDDTGRKNSIMTFYRIREKNLKKLINKSEVLYSKE